MKDEKSSGTAISNAVNLMVRILMPIFITLRACDVVDWPWYTVLAPLWAWAVIFVACAAFVGVVKVYEDSHER